MMKSHASKHFIRITAVWWFLWHSQDLMKIAQDSPMLCDDEDSILRPEWEFNTFITSLFRCTKHWFESWSNVLFYSVLISTFINHTPTSSKKLDRKSLLIMTFIEQNRQWNKSMKHQHYCLPNDRYAFSVSKVCVCEWVSCVCVWVRARVSCVCVSACMCMYMCEWVSCVCVCV